LFEYIRPAVEFAQLNKELPQKVAILWDERNKQRGFLWASSLITQAIWAVIVIAINWILEKGIPK